METGNLLSRYGPWLGLIGALLFSIMWMVAVVTDGNWVFGEETLSELGGDRPGAIFFNTGVIAEGLMALIFAYSLLQRGNSKLWKAGTGLFILASLFLIGIGVFPINTGDPHTFFSYAFFGTVLLALSLIALPVGRLLGRSASILTIALIGVSLALLVMTSIPLTEAVAVICLLIWSGVVSLMIKARDPRSRITADDHT